MKQFHFSLEAVLRVRAQQLEKSRQIFAEGLQWRARAAAAVANTQSEIDSCHAALTARRECRTTRTDQLLFLNALQYQQSVLRSLQDEFARAEREVAIRRGSMILAQRKLDALEKLKERKQTAHRAEAERREATMMDDLISARYILSTAEVAT
ncbi:MAG: flagellar export protein FliJ [Chthoniobacteraceae bacterium]